MLLLVLLCLRSTQSGDSSGSSFSYRPQEKGKFTMKKLSSFVATCILLLSLTAVAFADGGITQTPGSKDDPPPPPGGGAPSASETAPDQFALAASELAWLATWLEQSIL